MISAQPRICLVFAAAALFTGLTGCGEFADTDITGTILGESFSAVSGTAEGSAATGYSIVLADDGAYDCASTPSGNYLTVVIGGVDSTGTVNATGATVTFNAVEDDFQNSEPADTGSFTIDVLSDDDDIDPRIEGSIDAAGPTSDVSGTFSVPICD